MRSSPLSSTRRRPDAAVVLTRVAPPRKGELHLWRVVLHETAPPSWDVLSSDERARARRFIAPGLADRWVRSRTALRTILGRYCDRSPTAVTLVVSDQGKPALAGASGAVSFNVSDVEALALVAVVPASVEVGVDLEALQPVPERDAIARQLFSAPEAARLAAVPESERDRAFLECWTRKEAVVKAVGVGLLAPLDDFEVVFAAKGPLWVRSLGRSGFDAGRWQLIDLSAGIAGHVAACALDGPAVTSVRWFEFDPA